MTQEGVGGERCSWASSWERHWAFTPYLNSSAPMDMAELRTCYWD